MNKIHPKKLLNSKWTARKPLQRQKHFIVVETEFDDQQKLIRCVIQALMTKQEHEIEWRELQNEASWRQGWK